MKKFNIDWRWYLWILFIYLFFLPIKPTSPFLDGWVISYGPVGLWTYILEYPLSTIIIPSIIFYLIKGAYALWKKYNG